MQKAVSGHKKEVFDEKKGFSDHAKDGRVIRK